MLRECVRKYLATNGAEASASDERWKTRQTQQLFSVEHKVKDLDEQLRQLRFELASEASERADSQMDAYRKLLDEHHRKLREELKNGGSTSARSA